MKIYHTKTQEDYDALMRKFEREGIRWGSGYEAIENNIWHCHEEGTCVRVFNEVLAFEGVSYYKLKYPEVPIIEYTAQKNNYKEGEYCCLPKKEIVKRINDAVNSPTHYMQGERETIETIRDTMSSEGYQGYCVGNVVKYLSRYKFKNGLEDVRKAKSYIKFLEEELVKQEERQ